MKNNTNLTEKILNWGAVLYVICSVLVPAGYIMHPATADHMHSSQWEITHGLLLIPLALFPMLLAVLYVPRIKKAGLVSLFGYVISVLGLIFIFGLDYIETFFNPVLAIEEPGWVARHGAGESVGAITFVFPLSALAFGIGYIMLCAGLLRSGDLPGKALWLGILSVFPMLAGAYFPATLIGYFGPAVFGIANIWLGFSIWNGSKQTILVILILSILFCLGLYLLTPKPDERSIVHMINHTGQIEVGAVNPPTIEIRSNKDKKHGWNLEVITTNFKFSPENSGKSHIEGEGHGHIAINGIPYGRIYSNWYYIDHLQKGENKISVSLNSNSHDLLSVNGKPISDEIIIFIE